MCFTVAIVRNNALLTVQEYYNSLPVFKGKQAPKPEFEDHFFVSGFTHPLLPVISAEGVELQQWGLIPSWVKDELSAKEIRSKTLNAVGETVFEKPSFRQSILRRRGVLPLTGFFEWRDVQKVKYPYFIQFAHPGSLAVGVIYDSWMNPASAKAVNSFSIVTTAANPLMEMIHNTKKRMPLILEPDGLDAWLNPGTPAEVVRELIQPCSESRLKAYTISRNVNNPRLNHNFAEILQELRYPELDYQSNTLF
jgi:putative SOS response-associated peptidase YedK